MNCVAQLADGTVRCSSLFYSNHNIYPITATWSGLRVGECSLDVPVRIPDSKYKYTAQMDGVFIWLGLYNLFQTFEELDEVKDIPAGNQIIREVIEGEGSGR